MNYQEIQKQIEKLALAAGRMILDAEDTDFRDVRVTTKTGRRDMVTSMDLAIQQMLMTELMKIVPGCRFLVEESIPSLSDVIITDDNLTTGDAADPGLRGVCFIIDPIDGTANFVHGNRHSCTSSP